MDGGDGVGPGVKRWRNSTCPSTRFLKRRLSVLRQIRAGDSVNCGECPGRCLMFCCFLRDAPAESNAVSTIPNQTADADTCSLAWAETATTPKQRNLAAQKNKLASKPKRIGFIVCLGHVFVSVGPEIASRPKRLRPRRRHLQPRMLGRNNPDAETAQIAPRRQKTNQPRSRNGLGSCLTPEAT